MRIVIDLQGAQCKSRFRGIGRYSLALALALARNGGDHELWLALNSAYGDSLAPIRQAFAGLIPPERICCFAVPTPLNQRDPENVWLDRAAEQIRFAFLAELQPDAVLIGSLFEGWLEDVAVSVGGEPGPWRTAIILYDLIPYLDQDTYLGDPWIRTIYHKKIGELRQADLLLAISDHARQEAIKALALPPEQVVAISSAISELFRPLTLAEPERQALRDRYGLDQPFLMYNGVIEARKNLPRLLEAFALLPAELRNRHCLLLVGKATEVERRQLLQQAEQLGIGRRLRMPGYVPDHDLIALYSVATLFVFPSLHEGFGLPPLEAMACGAPTIGSNTTSIPEVIGLAEALFDPTDPAAMAAKIERALTEPTFCQRLRDHGLAQARHFSWDLCATRALRALESLEGRERPAAPLAWPEKVAGREGRYRALLATLARLPGRRAGERDLLAVAAAIAANQVATDCLFRRQELPASLCWRLEGPFDSSYSLALLNRETARALAQLGHTVLLHSTEGPGDFLPAPEFLQANPDLAAMYRRGQELSPAHCPVVSRNLYPPRVADMVAPLNLLHHYAWEESGFPAAWADSFNDSLQGITCLSRHVEKILIDHGVALPLVTSGCGVDHWERVEASSSYPLRAKGFRFLHVSSCFPRKGADLLLAAYGQAFTVADEVSLVIKTFPNPHNEIHRWLAERRQGRKDFPEVVIIEDDLTDGELKALYRQCHCLVAPSRAEGFGLPLAEAMLSGLPVIATGWSGQLDFCSEESAWLLDYTFVRAQTHFQLHDSVWAEPDVNHLARTMREVWALPEEARHAKSGRGRALLLAKFRWQDAAARLVAAARSWSVRAVAPEPRLGWVTTWNTRCGIATYSAHLLEQLPARVTILANHTPELPAHDGPEVIRCWPLKGQTTPGVAADYSELATAVADQELDTLVIQFQYGFFPSLEVFGSFLAGQLDAGRQVVLMLHSTVDPALQPEMRLATIAPVLKRCQRLCVHSVPDLNRLKKLGLVENVTLFPHGIIDLPPAPPPVAKAAGAPRLLASYGFFLPHKGLLELIEAVALLLRAGENLELLMVNAEFPAPDSTFLIQQAQARIAALGFGGRIRLVSDYLNDEECLAYLAEADLIVFPYQQTGESCSGAVRYGIASGRPVVVTPLPIFEDVAPAVFTLPGIAPRQIADGLAALLKASSSQDPEFQATLAAAERWRADHRYSRLAPRLYGMVKSLAMNKD